MAIQINCILRRKTKQRSNKLVFLKFKVKCKLKKLFSFSLDLYTVFFAKILSKCVYENMKSTSAYAKMKKKITESNSMSSPVRNIHK